MIRQWYFVDNFNLAHCNHTHYWVFVIKRTNFLSMDSFEHVIGNPRHLIAPNEAWNGRVVGRVVLGFIKILLHFFQFWTFWNLFLIFFGQFSQAFIYWQLSQASYCPWLQFFVNFFIDFYRFLAILCPYLSFFAKFFIIFFFFLQFFSFYRIFFILLKFL